MELVILLVYVLKIKKEMKMISVDHIAQAIKHSIDLFAFVRQNFNSMKLDTV